MVNESRARAGWFSSRARVASYVGVRYLRLRQSVQGSIFVQALDRVQRWAVRKHARRGKISCPKSAGFCWQVDTVAKGFVDDFSFQFQLQILLGSRSLIGASPTNNLQLASTRRDRDVGDLKAIR